MSHDFRFCFFIQEFFVIDSCWNTLHIIHCVKKLCCVYAHMKWIFACLHHVYASMCRALKCWRAFARGEEELRANLILLAEKILMRVLFFRARFFAIRMLSSQPICERHHPQTRVVDGKMYLHFLHFALHIYMPPQQSLIIKEKF